MKNNILIVLAIAIVLGVAFYINTDFDIVVNETIDSVTENNIVGKVDITEEFKPTLDNVFEDYNIMDEIGESVTENLDKGNVYIPIEVLVYLMQGGYNLYDFSYAIQGSTDDYTFDMDPSENTRYANIYNSKRDKFVEVEIVYSDDNYSRGFIMTHNDLDYEYELDDYFIDNGFYKTVGRDEDGMIFKDYTSNNIFVSIGNNGLEGKIFESYIFFRFGDGQLF